MNDKSLLTEQGQVITNNDYALMIIKCSDSMRWYSDKVGQLVDFLGDNGDEFLSCEVKGFLTHVEYDDAIIVNRAAPRSIAGTVLIE